MPQAECRICHKRFKYSSIEEHNWFPFCSRRCRLVDLGKWFEEEYRFCRRTDESQETAPEEDDK